jgi:SulP family sulfate permease
MAGFLASGLGESKVLISAPSMLFVTVASTIISKQGLLGLSLTTSLAGIFLIFLAGTGLAAAVPFVSRAIVTGLLSGVAVLVVCAMVPSLFYSPPPILPDEIWTGAKVIFQRPFLISPSATIMAMATLTVILLCRKVSALVPASLIATAIGVLVVKLHPLPVQTIGTSSGSILWLFHTSRTELFSLDFLSLVGPAFSIAILAAFQSLHAKDLASGLAGERSSSRVELFVQGGVNVGCSLVGGLPVAGSYVYTSANVRGGAQTPVAGMLQAAFVLAFFFLAIPLVPSIPLPVMSGILLSGVCTMPHWREIPGLMKASRRDACAWLATALLTLAMDILTVIAVGMLVAMFLYIRNYRREPVELS